MRLGNPQIIECPFYGTEKRIYSVLSRTIVNFGACYWSDNKRVDPIPFEVSFVQKCPKCGKYYILSRQKEKYAEAKDTSVFRLDKLMETV